MVFNKRDIYPSPQESFNFSLKSIQEVKESCVFVLDANVLLLPFTTDLKSLNNIREIYSKLVNEGRLFVPAQVAREYVDNRATKLTDLYKNLTDKSSQNFNKICPHPLLSGMDEYSKLERLESDLDKAFKEYRSHIQEIISSIKNWGWDDPVSKMYHDILSDCVLGDPKIEVSEVEKDLDRRNSLKVPPGYKDGGKDDNSVGDLLIWHEILELARERDQDVIFVSGDSKSDWWHRSGKKPIYPRFELVDEFREKVNGKSFNMISLSQLLTIFEAPDDVVDSVESSEKAEKEGKYREDRMIKHLVDRAVNTSTKVLLNAVKTPIDSARESVYRNKEFVRNELIKRGYSLVFEGSKGQLYVDSSSGNDVLLPGGENDFSVQETLDILNFLYTSD